MVLNCKCLFLPQCQSSSVYIWLVLNAYRYQLAPQGVCDRGYYCPNGSKLPTEVLTMTSTPRSLIQTAITVPRVITRTITSFDPHQKYIRMLYTFGASIFEKVKKMVHITWHNEKTPFKIIIKSPLRVLWHILLGYLKVYAIITREP